MPIPRKINPSRVNDFAWAAFWTISSIFVDMVSVRSGDWVNSLTHSDQPEDIGGGGVGRLEGLGGRDE